MSRITHPRPEVGRQRHLGITFFDGFADHDLTGQPELAESLLQHGFTIGENQPDAEAPFEPLPPAADAEKVSKPRKPKSMQSIVERLDSGATVTHTPDGEGGIILGIED